MTNAPDHAPDTPDAAVSAGTAAPGTTSAVPHSPLLDRPGAVAGEGADAGVAAHYGDPVREQRLLSEGLAVVDLSHRGVVRVAGTSWQTNAPVSSDDGTCDGSIRLTNRGIR